MKRWRGWFTFCIQEIFYTTFNLQSRPNFFPSTRTENRISGTQFERWAGRGRGYPVSNLQPPTPHSHGERPGPSTAFTVPLAGLASPQPQPQPPDMTSLGPQFICRAPNSDAIVPYGSIFSNNWVNMFLLMIHGNVNDCEIIICSISFLLLLEIIWRVFHNTIWGILLILQYAVRIYTVIYTTICNRRRGRSHHHEQPRRAEQYRNWFNWSPAIARGYWKQ